MLKSLLFLLTLLLPSVAEATIPPYDGVIFSTTTGTATHYTSGKLSVASSSNTTASPTAVIDGTTGNAVFTGTVTANASAVTNNSNVGTLSVQGLPTISVSTGLPTFSSDLIAIQGKGLVRLANTGGLTVNGTLTAPVGGALSGSLPNPTLASTNWSINLGNTTLGGPNLCDTFTFNPAGQLVGTNDPGLCQLAESQVTNLGTDLAAKYPISGGSILGNARVQGNLAVDSNLSAYTIVTTTGMNVGPGNVQPTGVSSSFAGSITVGNGTWTGGVNALNGISQFLDLNIIDPVNGSTQTIVSTGGARFGCNGGISPGCGVQTIGGDGKIPQFDAAHFANLDISAATGSPAFLSNYLPLVGGTLTGSLTMSNHLNNASTQGNISFVDPYYHSIVFKATASPSGWPLGQIQWVQGGTGMHRIISFDGQNTASRYPGILQIGADQTASESQGNRGVVLSGNGNITPDVYVSTYMWTSIGTTSPTANGSTYGLYVNGNIISTGSLTTSGYFYPQSMTMVQAQAALPGLGAVVVCTTCSRPYTILVGTGTAVDQWREQGYSTGAQ